jgi:predicted 3-demethylubiquinone-9 3-methyltransferase (glyoxalase superfamily)
MNVTPFLMFEGDAEQAMNFYVSLFPGAHITSLARYDAKGPGQEGKIAQAVFQLNGQMLRCFDSPMKHGFTFTPAISLFAECDSAEDVDRLFAALSEGGKVLMGLDAYPFARRFGWCNDRFGVSWQVRFA